MSDGHAASGSLQVSALQRSTVLNDVAVESEILLSFTGACTEIHERWGLEEEYQRRAKRYYSAMQRDEEVWGAAPENFERYTRPRPGKCRKSIVVAALARLDKFLDLHDAAFSRATMGIDRGVWVGSIKLCKTSVVETGFATAPVGDYPVVSVQLTPQASASFATLTRNAVRLKLAVRFEGAIISKPFVSEPIETGFFHVSAPDEPTLKRVRAAIEESDC